MMKAKMTKMEVKGSMPAPIKKAIEMKKMAMKKVAKKMAKKK